MAEKLNEIDIDVTEKIPEATPYAGALPFMKMCEGMGLYHLAKENSLKSSKRKAKKKAKKKWR